jgi:ABC-type multidrug transport system fused ATPase/permease subunit
LKRVLKNTFAVLTEKEKQRIYFLVILDVVMSILDISSLALLLFIIKFYTTLLPTADIPYLPAWLLDRNSLLLIAIFFLLFSLKNFAGFLVFKAQYHFIYKVASRISENNLLKYLEGNYTEYANIDSSVHIRKISQEPIEFSHYVLAGILQIMANTILIILTITAIILFKAKLFLLLFLILLPPVIVSFYFLRKRLRSVRTYTKSTGEKALQHLKEALSGFVESNIYDKNKFFIQRFAAYQKKLNTYLSELIVVQGMPSRFIEVFAVLGLFILIAIHNWSGNQGAADIVTIGAFMAAAYKIIPGLVKILNLSGQIKAYEFTINDLVEIPTTTPKVYHSTPLQSIEFKDVCFNFKDQVVIHHLNLSVEGGDMVGISGNSGIGKTTLVNLLLGFFSPDNGEIAINHTVTSAADRRMLWKNISYARQQPFLIHDTILKNIILDDDNYNVKRVEEIIAMTGLDELVQKFPEDLNKTISENGKNISGGQRQRISLARTLYKNSDLVILDESFSELDDQSEISLLHHMKSISLKGKLIMLITHNKESLSFCNKTIFLNEK